MAIREELTNKHYSLNQRLKLFDLIVSATMLCGTAAWTLTKSLETHVQRTQRKMLRMMLNYPRKVISKTSEGVQLEPWVDWIKRTTYAAEDRLAGLRLRDWVESHHDAKRKWHKQLAEGPSNNWAYWAYHWTPAGKRKVGSPKKRWSDEI